MILTYVVKEKNLTINQILKKEFDFSNRLLSKLIKNSYITLNEKSCDTRMIADLGDLIKINFDYFEDNSNIIPKKMHLDIVYEDEWLIILNKPAQIATHPSLLHFEDSLSNGLKFYFDKINLHKKIRPVNRLDFGTSGLIIFAKNEYIQECLINQMLNNQFKKEYYALVHGILSQKQGIINKPIARKENSIIERCISESGKSSITHYSVLQEYVSFSLVKCKLETGRTHQIRVHFASIGHPLIGDTLYGKKSNITDCFALNCCRLQFFHPIYKKNLEFKTSLENNSIFLNIINH